MAHGLLIVLASLVLEHRLQGARASVVKACGLSSCGSQALEHRLSSCGARAQLIRALWDLPGSGVEPESPVSAGGFFTAEPPGSPQLCSFKKHSKQKLQRVRSLLCLTWVIQACS